jgi:hypothetical protein
MASELRFSLVVYARVELEKHLQYLRNFYSEDWAYDV